MSYKSIDEVINNAKFTILIGKNGVGKSTLLRKYGNANPNSKYITPERGGFLKYDASISHAINNSPSWQKQDRNKNQSSKFREQSIDAYALLQHQVLSEIEKNTDNKRSDINYTFDSIIEKINNILPNINLERKDQKSFDITDKNNIKIAETNISSGESELISLAIEILVFSKGEDKVLILDEPDVHLHPDLQSKLINFLEEIAKESNFKTVIATHSTAIIGGFSKDADIQICPISNKNQDEYNTFGRDKICNEILPIFGVHPLSSHFNTAPILLVEGDDDKRVIEQIIRTSKHNITFMPVVVETVVEMKKWEKWLNDFLPSIYDEPKAFSLRDGDKSPNDKFDNQGIVIRAKLNCYAVENILLTDEVFEKYNFNEATFKDTLKNWFETSSNHRYTEEAKRLFNNFNQRRTLKIKNLRNIIVMLLETSKPWEVIIGQVIAENYKKQTSGEHSLCNYLGAETINKLFNE